jgi:ClpP class serine protease
MSLFFKSTHTEKPAAEPQIKAYGGIVRADGTKVFDAEDINPETDSMHFELTGDICEWQLSHDWIEDIGEMARYYGMKNIVLEVTSYGGDLDEGLAIRGELQSIIDSGIAVTVYVPKLLLSAAYPAFSNARIVAHPYSLVGSLSGFINLYDTSKAAKDAGEELFLFETGKDKEFFVYGQEMTPERKAVWQKKLDEGYGMLKSVVRENRNLGDEYFTGAQWRTSEGISLKAGIIDVIGTREDARATDSVPDPQEETEDMNEKDATVLQQIAKLLGLDKQPAVEAAATAPVIETPAVAPVAPAVVVNAAAQPDTRLADKIKVYAAASGRDLAEVTAEVEAAELSPEDVAGMIKTIVLAKSKAASQATVKPGDETPTEDKGKPVAVVARTADYYEKFLGLKSQG